MSLAEVEECIHLQGLDTLELMFYYIRGRLRETHTYKLGDTLGPSTPQFNARSTAVLYCYIIVDIRFEYIARYTTAYVPDSAPFHDLDNELFVLHTGETARIAGDLDSS